MSCRSRSQARACSSRPSRSASAPRSSFTVAERWARFTASHSARRSETGSHGFSMYACTPPRLIASTAVRWSEYAVRSIRRMAGWRVHTMWQSSMPLMCGMRWSATSTAMRSRSSSCRASSADCAVWIVNSSENMARKTRRFSGSSST